MRLLPHPALDALCSRWRELHSPAEELSARGLQLPPGVSLDVARAATRCAAPELVAQLGQDGFDPRARYLELRSRLEGLWRALDLAVEAGAPSAVLEALEALGTEGTQALMETRHFAPPGLCEPGADAQDLAALRRLAQLAAAYRRADEDLAAAECLSRGTAAARGLPAAEHAKACLDAKANEVAAELAMELALRQLAWEVANLGRGDQEPLPRLAPLSGESYTAARDRDADRQVQHRAWQMKQVERQHAAWRSARAREAARLRVRALGLSVLGLACATAGLFIVSGANALPLALVAGASLALGLQSAWHWLREVPLAAPPRAIP